MPELWRPGIRLHYEVAGQGPGVLCTHGFAATSHMFAANLPALSGDHRVVTWDLPGHGRSGSPPDEDPYTRPAVVDDMAALLDEVGVGRAVLVGHSVGGSLSLEFTLAHPDRVVALVLLDSGPGFRRPERRRAWNDRCERYATALADRGLAALQGSDELDGGVHRRPEGLVRSARGYLRQDTSRVIDALGSLDLPALVVVGAEDAAYLEGSRYMARALPRAELVEIEGAAHAPNLSHRLAFETALRRFLDAVCDEQADAG
jgi:pimeloyl-ACP methyl ester carboxylesterase